MTLAIDNLYVSVESKEILKGVSLTLKSGETHFLMGPNGSGKSTLALAAMGHPNYQITQGTIRLNGEDITSLPPGERARRGLFLAFQSPVEVPGVGLATFLKAACNQQVSIYDFRQQLKEKLKILQMGEEFLDRNLNEGFSGGEKKKTEILQLMVLEPQIAILDETDSGLDTDALKTVSVSLERLFQERQDRALLIITHQQRILHYIKPDYVHLMIGGRIVKSGGADLARELEETGYESLHL